MDYMRDIERENIPLLRFDPSFILSFRKYLNQIALLEKNGLKLIPLEDVVQVIAPPRFATRRLRLQKQGVRSFVITSRTIKPLSLNPNEAQIAYVPNKKYVITPHTILFTETGSKIENVSILPEYLSTFVRSTYQEEIPIAATHHLIRGVVKSDVDPYYLATLYNTQFGNLLIKISTYGAVKPELNQRILEKVKILRLTPMEEDQISKLVKEAFEDYENLAWRSYMQAKRYVAANLPFPSQARIFSSIVDFSKFKITRRLDPKFLIMDRVISDLTKKVGAKIVRVKDWFHVRKGTAPMNRDYKDKNGDPYIPSQAIAKSGVVDEKGFYYLPPDEQTGKEPRAHIGSILITTDAHDVRGIGKVGIVHPYDNIMVMSGLAILEPKEDADPYYAFAIFKSKILNITIKSCTYGLTAHLAKKSIEILPIPIIESIQENVSKTIKTFLDNLYRARELKRKAISTLESKIHEVIKYSTKD